MGNKKSSSKKKSKINQQTDVSTATVVDTMARATLHRPNDDSRPQARGSSQRNDAGSNPPTATESRNQAPLNDTGHTGASGSPPDRQRPTPANVTASTADSGSNTPASERSTRVVNSNNNTGGNSEPNSTRVPIAGDDSIGRDRNVGNAQASLHDQKVILTKELLNTVRKMESSNLFPGMQYNKLTPEELIGTHAGAQELIPHDAPEPLGKRVVQTTHVDANLLHDLLQGNSVTGIFHFLNQTPIDGYSRKQPTVETSTYGSEFVAAKLAVQQIINLRLMLRYLGVPVYGTTFLFGDNESVVKSGSIPHSRLKK